MGLAEKRSTKSFQDNQFVELQKQIHQAAGFAVPIEVDWDQLAQEGRGDYYVEMWTKVYFKPIIDGLGTITRDDMGKEALRESLKKIELRNSKDTSNPDRAITFESGVLTIDHNLSNVDYIDERTKTVISTVEKGL